MSKLSSLSSLSKYDKLRKLGITSPKLVDCVLKGYLGLLLDLVIIDFVAEAGLVGDG